MKYLHRKGRSQGGTADDPDTAITLAPGQNYAVEPGWLPDNIRDECGRHAHTHLDPPRCAIEGLGKKGNSEKTQQGRYEGSKSELMLINKTKTGDTYHPSG